MHKPTKGRQPLRLQDLASQIDCMQCQRKQSATGARRFHAWHVCADCTRKLDLLPPPQKSPSGAAR